MTQSRNLDKTKMTSMREWEIPPDECDHVRGRLPFRGVGSGRIYLCRCREYSGFWIPESYTQDRHQCSEGIAEIRNDHD